MLIVSEEVCEKVVDRKNAFQAIENIFSSMAKNSAYNFPVIREDIGYADALYGFKSGFDRAGKVLGLKSGGYWPGNYKQNLTNHQSTVFLFNPDTGQLKAIVAGNYLTAVRTAASSAVSIAHLSRKDAKIIGMVGAGHQSVFQLKAALEIRNFEKVIGWNIDKSMLDKLKVVAEEAGVPFESMEPEDLCSQADVIITITSAFEPLIIADWVKRGTHIACMGTDTRGKQEVDPAILAKATVFTDEITQSITIGEAQHACNDGLITETEITPIGAVINRTHPGRKSNDEITLFDGTGVGLQDLAVASLAAEIAKESGMVLEVSL